jgi:hypothetical protein
MRLPIAAAGSPQSSRARFSEMTATSPPVSISDHVMSRPVTKRAPMVAKYPGATHLNLRIGGVSLAV